MAFVLPEAVVETTTTSGTGDISLAGAKANRRAFSDEMSDSDTTFYTIFDGTDFESGIGTLSTAGGDSISRDTVLFSTNGNSAVDWPSSGTRTVVAGIPGKALQNLLVPTSTGIPVKTGDNEWVFRQIVDLGSAGIIQVTNQTGVDGNPTIDDSALGTAATKDITGASEIELIRKVSNQTVNNSTTLVTDNTLQFPIAANEGVLFMFVILRSGNVTADFKCTVDAATKPAAHKWTIPNAQQDAAGTLISGTADAFGSERALNGSGVDVSNVIFGHARQGSVGSVIEFKWAQNTADASDTKVLDGSFLIVWRI